MNVGLKYFGMSVVLRKWIVGCERVCAKERMIRKDEKETVMLLSRE